MSGSFIVIEGADGSGKSTQFKALLSRLKKDNIECTTTHFPRYEEDSSFFVRKMLKGEYGPLEDQDPYRCSLFYTLDRYDASFELRNTLESGVHFISDRYASSNVGHQGGKFNSDEERMEYFKWLDRIEYETFGIPKPDLVIYLYVPFEISQANMLRRLAEQKEGSMDIHEDNEHHIRDAIHSYQLAANNFDYWQQVDCTADGQMRSIEDIHEEVYKLVTKQLTATSSDLALK